MDSNNLLVTLHDIKDRCFIYSIMLADASSSLGKMKIIFKLPAIFISVLLSVLNSSKFNESEEISVVNTVLNAFIALLIGVENTLQIDNKKQVFTSTKNKFEKLMSNIEKKILDTSEPTSVEFVQNCITEFEQIDDDLTFDIPKSVRNRVKRDFLGKRTLPLILGGEKRTDALPLSDTYAQQVPLLASQNSLTQQPSQLSQLTQLTQLTQPSQLSQLTQPQQLTQTKEQYSISSKIPKIFQKISTLSENPSQLSQLSQLSQKLQELSMISQPSQPSQPSQLSQLTQPSQPSQLMQPQQPQGSQLSNHIQLPQVLQVIKPDLTHTTFERLEEGTALTGNALELIPEQEQYDEIMDIIDPNAPRQL
jgi:hypothetical protein